MHTMGFILAVRRLVQCGVLVCCAALAACGGRADQDESGGQGGGISEVTGGQPGSNVAGASTGGTQSQGGAAAGTGGGSSAGGALEVAGGSSGSSGQSATWSVTDPDIHPTCHAELAECGGFSFVADPVLAPSAPLRNCELPLPHLPEAPNLISLVADCEVIPADDPTAGWELHIEESIVLLKGENCERVHTRELNSVSVYYACGIWI